MADEEARFHIEVNDMIGRWIADVVRGVDHFIGYVRFTLTPLDEVIIMEEAQRFEFYVWWTQPTPPYYSHTPSYSSSDQDSERTFTDPLCPIPFEDNLAEVHQREEYPSENPKKDDLDHISSQSSCS